MFILLFVTFFFVIPFVATLLLLAFVNNFLRESIWLAFYASIPLFIYDFITVGIIEKGLNNSLQIINYTSNQQTQNFIVSEALKIVPD